MQFCSLASWVVFTCPIITILLFFLSAYIAFYSLTSCAVSTCPIIVHFYFFLFGIHCILALCVVFTCLITVQFHYFSLPHTLYSSGLANHVNEFDLEAATDIPRWPRLSWTTLVSFVNLFLQRSKLSYTKFNIFSFSSSTFSSSNWIISRGFVYCYEAWRRVHTKESLRGGVL